MRNKCKCKFQMTIWKLQKKPQKTPPEKTSHATTKIVVQFKWGNRHSLHYTPFNS